MIFDDTFDMTRAAAQDHFRFVCEQAVARSAELDLAIRGGEVLCPIIAFDEWTQATNRTNGSRLEGSQFLADFTEFISTFPYSRDFGEYAGFDVATGELKYLAAEFNTTLVFKPP